MFIGAHIHTADLRAPKESYNNSVLDIPLIVTPSVSPIYDNNPAYSILEINQQT